jgi:hypothetical protein
MAHVSCGTDKCWVLQPVGMAWSMVLYPHGQQLVVLRVQSPADTCPTQLALPVLLQIGYGEAGAMQAITDASDSSDGVVYGLELAIGGVCVLRCILMVDVWGPRDGHVMHCAMAGHAVHDAL